MKNGEDYVVGVWPGKSVLPGFPRSRSERWFGKKYNVLTDMGIEGFWNDMNEPALFYSEKGYNNALKESRDLPERKARRTELLWRARYTGTPAKQRG